MYDELVKRLRECTAEQNGEKTLWHQAADAIEKLSAYVELYQDLAGKNQQMARKLIEEKPRWIPVTERLPESEEDVLIAATVHTKKGDVRAVTGDFINTAGQWNGASCSWRYEVTHWMPLPEPPKEET